MGGCEDCGHCISMCERHKLAQHYLSAESLFGELDTKELIGNKELVPFAAFTPHCFARRQDMAGAMHYSNRCAIATLGAEHRHTICI